MDGGQKTRNEHETSELEEACTTKAKLKLNEKTEKSSKKQVNKCKLSLFRNSIKSVKSLVTDVDLNETDEFQDKQVPLKLPERLTRKKLKKTSDNVEYYSPIKQPSVGESVPEDGKISSETTQQTCPTCQKQIAPLQMQAHILLCLKQFVSARNRLDDEKRCDSDTTSYHLCQICQKDISHMNTTRRAQHVNRCIDEKEKVDHEKKEKKRLLETAKTAVLDCPICGKPLKTAQSRQAHIKKCALTYGVATERLLKLIKEQEGERALQVTAGILPNTVSLPTKVSRDGEKINKKQRLPRSKSDEDLQLAMALSTSIAEQERLQEEVVAGGSRLPQGKKSRVKKKASEAIPLILQLTKQQAVERISGKVTELLLPPSSVRQQQELSTPCGTSQIEALSVPCEVYSTTRNQQKTRLWNESKLIDEGGDIRQFYVEALMPSVAISTVKAGTKLKRMSEIPGRRSSFELERERELKQKSDNDILQQTQTRSQPTSPPSGTQTAAILAELAAEADINSSLPEKCKNNNQSQEDLHFSGFCPEDPVEIPEDLLRPIKDGFSSSILSLVSNEMYSDVTIETRERNISAHKIFLHARCPKMLESLCVDGVTIDMSVYSEDVVLTILKFIYAGEVMVYPASLQDVLQLSSCLELTELKEICESIIKRKPDAQDIESKEAEESNLLDNTLWSSSDSEEDMAEGHAEGEEVQGQENEEENEWREMFYTQSKNLCKISTEECLKNNESNSDDDDDDDNEDNEEIDDDGDDNINNGSEEEVMDFLLKEHADEKSSGKNNTENILECKNVKTFSLDSPSVSESVETAVLDKVPSASNIFYHEQADRQLESLPDVTKGENSKEDLNLMKSSQTNKYSELLSVNYSQKQMIDGNIENSGFVQSNSKDMKISKSHSVDIASPVNPNIEMAQDASHTCPLSDQELFSDDDGILTVDQCLNVENEFTKESSEDYTSGCLIRDLSKQNQTTKKKQGNLVGSSSLIKEKSTDYQENSITHPILLSDSDSNEEEIKLDPLILRNNEMESESRELHRDKRVSGKHESDLDEISDVSIKQYHIPAIDVHAKKENKRNPKYKFVSIEKRSNTKNEPKLLVCRVNSNFAGGDTGLNRPGLLDSKLAPNSPVKSKTTDTKCSPETQKQHTLDRRCSLTEQDSLYMTPIPTHKSRSTFMLTTPNPETFGDKQKADATDGENAGKTHRKDKTSCDILKTKSPDQPNGSFSNNGRLESTNDLDALVGKDCSKISDSINNDDDDDDVDESDDDDEEVVIYSANSDEGQLSSSPKFKKRFQKTSDKESDNGNDEDDPWEGFNDVGYTEDMVEDMVESEEDPVVTLPEEMSEEMTEEDISHQHEEPQINFKTPTVSESAKKKRKKKNWVPPSPFTPLPDYNSMNTPQLKKNIDKFGLRPACKKRMISVLTQIYAETHQYETDSDCDLDMERLEKANQAKLKKITSKNEEKHGKKKKTSKPMMKPNKSTAQTCLPPVCVLGDVASDDPLSSSQSSDISDLPEESFIATAEEESSSSTSQFTKEDLFKKLAAFIQYDTDLYSQILMYQPVELDVLKKRIGDAGMKCSMEKLLEFLDEKCINFTMKNTNKRKPKNQRRRPKTRKNKSTLDT